MTLALKDYNELKSKFNDCIAFVLKREDKKEISQLPSRRRDELQFLTSVIKELDARISEAKINDQRPEKRPELLKPYVNILYGAMCVINQDITNRMTSLESGSRVQERLELAMGMKDAQPSPEQYVTFYKSLNNFLNLIYVDNDSRKGFKKEHALMSIPVHKLEAFANISFEKEEMAQNNVNAQLVVADKSHGDGSSWYKATHNADAIAARLGTFDELKEELHQLILDETAAKDKSDISALDAKRVIQLGFLQKLADALSAKKAEKIKDADKTAILAGAMYLVRGQIAREYGEEPLSHADIVAGYIKGGSVVHTKLTTILKAKETCFEDVEVLLAAASQYIRNASVQNIVEKDVHKESIRPDNIFSAIKDFSLNLFLTLANNMIKSCRSKALDHCVVEMKKEIEAAKPKEPSTSYASSLYNWWKKPVAKQEEDEETLEDQKNVEASSSVQSTL